MSQNTTVKSPNRSQVKPSINPGLQAALGSLDVQLEEELSRYRRQKTARPATYPRVSGASSTRKSIELISVNRQGEAKESPTSRMTNFPATIPFPIALSNQTSVGDSPQKTVERDTPPSSTTSEKTNILAFPSSRQAESKEATTTETAPPQGNPAKQPQQQDTDLLQSPPPNQPEEYLESSEKLLRSLAESESASKQVSKPGSKSVVESKKRFNNRIFTPVGIGSILLLLLSSATLTYMLLNPYTRSSLNISGTAITPPTPKPPTTNNNNPSKTSPNIIGPNLDSNEFTEVNLNTLSHLEANPQPKTLPSPVTPIPNQPSGAVTQPSSSYVEEFPPNPGNSGSLPAAILNPPLPPGGIPPVAQPSVTPQPKSTVQPKSTAPQRKKSNSTKTS
jgi:hypothetical protein